LTRWDPALPCAAIRSGSPEGRVRQRRRRYKK